MGRREGKRSDYERESKIRSIYSFETYLLQLQLHRDNITTGYALYLVSSVGKHKSVL